MPIYFATGVPSKRSACIKAVTKRYFPLSKLEQTLISMADAKTMVNPRKDFYQMINNLINWLIYLGEKSDEK